MARTFGHWRLSSQTINFSVRIVNGIIHPSRSNQMKQKLGSRKIKSSEDIIHNKSVQGKYTLENEWHYTDEGHLGWKRSRKKERKMSPWPGREECVRPCSSLRHQLHVSEAAWQFHTFPRKKEKWRKIHFLISPHLSSCFVKRSEFPQVRNVHSRAMLDQELGDL